jgi:putative spermidine/putrescine transport system ATP-binding protein
VLAGAAARALWGGDVTAAVRPEKVRLVDGDPQRGEIRAGGVVREVVYAGAETRVVVEADAGVVLTALLLNSAVDGRLPQRFDRVTLGWPSEAVHKLET